MTVHMLFESGVSPLYHPSLNPTDFQTGYSGLSLVLDLKPEVFSMWFEPLTPQEGSSLGYPLLLLCPR